MPNPALIDTSGEPSHLPSEGGFGISAFVERRVLLSDALICVAPEGRFSGVCRSPALIERCVSPSFALRSSAPEGSIASRHN
jgi:hypothetical protein